MDPVLPSFISRQVLDASYFFLNLKPDPAVRFGVSCGGLEKCAPDYAVRRSEFDFVGIELVISGRAKATIGGKRFDLRPGSIFGYVPDWELSIESQGVYPLTKYFVDLHGAESLALFEASSLGGCKVLDYSGVRWVEEIFRQLMQFGSRGGFKAERSCSLLAELLLLQVEDQEVAEDGKSSAAYLSYRRCRDLIEENYVRFGSVAELAVEVSLDQAYIARLFNRFDDESPYKKITRLKINRAARLLLKENILVKNVAEAVGYDDAAHFSRVFKNAYGVSPAQFPATVNRGRLDHAEA